MEPTVPNPRPGWQPCPLPWCDSTHNPDPDVEHTRQIADLDLDRHTVEVIYCQPQKAGHLKDPLIRVTWGADFAPYGVLDIPVHAAEALGSIFELLTVQTYMEFGAALARGAKGPGPARRVQW
ncbi:hypothetical protein OIE13_17080 [Streptosporangium sp. NBC_01810]|uniref:hypothetical protein n=1 Tax=Streptosporangium sp. NBC_01810 TaxID=2975951 RepID=UPI002DDBBB4D|nr:hypothetical protein [Streptosporangium sp. NBC_01810]WSA29441.1 hypothetical protein OIE13_17080 [Streptosporangium sp. NBC_01810]